MNRLILASLFAALPLASCFNARDRDASEGCDNVGYAIASRTRACSGDPDLANARYARFAAATRCTLTYSHDEDFACAYTVNAATCAQVAAAGDDIDRWIALDPRCATILSRADGSSYAPPPTANPLTSQNDACKEASAVIANRIAVCQAMGAVPSPTAVMTANAQVVAELDAQLACKVAFAAGTAPPKGATDACEHDAMIVDCSVVVAGTAAEILAATPSCSAVWGPR